MSSTVDKRYKDALNGLFAILQAIKYSERATLDQKLEAVEMWIKYLYDLKRALQFARAEKEKQKRLLGG